MSCIKVPIPSVPELPAPLTLRPPTPPIPPIPGLPNFCCKLPPVPNPLPPIPIPTVILQPEIIAIMNGYIDQVLGYLAALPLECPLE